MDFLVNYRSSQLKYLQTQLTNRFKSSRSQLEQRVSLIVQEISRNSAFNADDILKAKKELQEIKASFQKTKSFGKSQLKEMEKVVKQLEKETGSKGTFFFN